LEHEIDVDDVGVMRFRKPQYRESLAYLTGSFHDEWLAIGPFFPIRQEIFYFSFDNHSLAFKIQLQSYSLFT
jgi:hypothetical protein